MFPFSEELGGGGPLEARLRNMIISNANAGANANRSQDFEQPTPSTQQVAPNMMSVNSPIQAPQTEQPRLPPHMQSATPAQQEQYLANVAARAQEPPNPDGQSPQPGRKRPNQAQRRQMNSQLSIPIDTRPAHQSRSGHGYGPPGGQSQAQWGAHSHGAQQNPNHRHSQNQQYSPRFQQNGPPTPYSPQNFFPQGSPRSPMHQHQYGPHHQAAHRQGPHQSPPFQPSPYSPRQPQPGRQLYQPGPYHGQGRGLPQHNPQELSVQGAHLETLLQESISTVVIDPQEAAEKEDFRAVVERACRESIVEYERVELGDKIFEPSTVELQCFGSMMSGFATKASDMDLALLSPKSDPAPDSPDSPIPRLLEKKLLDLGFGARLLTRTRVPIIKLCQKPTAKLVADLLEEREKWESGFGAEHEDEEIDTETSGKEPNDKNADVVSPTPAKVSSKPSESSYKGKLANLKQKEHQSLNDYLNNAKRLLRKLGGRDITATSHDLNDEESKILNDVCKAFITGLASSELSSQLQTYQTIAPLFDNSLQPLQRTLHGISTQVEGERLAMAWKTRPLMEPDERRELQGLAKVEAWRVLQDKQGAIVESLSYDRLLWAAAERMKRISSLQLVFLEQMPYEEPLSYCARAQKLLDDLRGRASQDSVDTVAPVVVAHYVAGVTNKKIREALQASIHPNANVQRLGFQHRILQLAVDYEHALSIAYFDEAYRPDIEQYVAFLRGLDYTNATIPIRYHTQERVSTQTETEAALFAKIQTLPDPTFVSQNKPRDRYKDHLEFPKDDIGIQCDINFSAHLAIHNTLLLRCYSHCDPRVKLMILFIKHWAKVRGINTPYRGSLSSYGYVLMVLHYLVNVAQPFVCPNLQAVNKDPPPYLPPAEIEARTVCNGRDVRFWRNEAEIKNLADKKMLNHNHDTVGILLRGFFEYYAQSGAMSTVQHRGFDWGREVLSLRTMGGILTKQEKGWVGAKTVFETSVVAPPTPSTAKAPEPADSNETALAAETPDPKPTKPQAKAVEETKEIRHRYLFAIEDPFELDHNVARTVTHNGIVSIRDEFRRAWRIIRNVGKPEQRDGGLLDPLDTTGGGNTKGSWKELLGLIHGTAEEEKREVGGEGVKGGEGV